MAHENDLVVFGALTILEGGSNGTNQGWVHLLTIHI